jgi:hypothetical protein
MAVTLSDITAIKGDAAIGAGTAGTAANLANLPADELSIGALQTASAARALANKTAQEQYQKNLNDYMTNGFNTLDVNGIMEKDYDVVVPEYAKFAKNIAANLDVIMNPSNNFERYQELKQQEANLRGKIAKSKQQLALRQGAMTFIGQHAAFQTPENIGAVQQFSTQPIEDRDPGALVNLMPKYDLMQDTISKAANTAAMTATKQQDTSSPFMNTTSMTTYYKTAYDNAVKTLLGGDDEFNRPMTSVVQQAFNRAPDYIKNQYTDQGTGLPNIDQFAIDKLYGPLRNQDSVSIERNINPIYKSQLDQQNELARIAAQGRESRRNLAYGKSLDDNELKTFASEIPVRQVAIIKTGSQPIANAETIQLQGKGTKLPDWTQIGKYGTVGGSGGEVKAFPLTLDSWLMNAYSIPTGKEKVVDPVTRQVVSEDSFDRPQNAWVTGEQNPNARKVIIRYQTKEGPKDLVIPYAENLQLLNNVAGPTNAVKLGAAKTQLFKQKFKTVSPSYEMIESDPEFSNPNAGTNALDVTQPGQLPTEPGTGIPLEQQTSTVPGASRNVTGTLNYGEWKKQHR